MKYFKFLSFAILAVSFALFSCSKKDNYESSEETQLTNFRKSIEKDTAFVYDADGIILEITEMGDEEYQPDDVVYLIYTGVAMQKNVVFAKDETLSFVYGDNNLIKGWKSALPYIKKNSKGTLVISFSQGYGKERVGVIDPYSTLKFTFEAL
ncbi:MAG: FKBP-type peptidyl-prolyl cis-trans isomerase [Bacteroidales bacterium]|nr:FKBP-type peptidyl-prolyl cis-trans isomerase [Bacteroidales bacterium]